MGAGQSDLYKGTYGDDPNNIPDELKGKIKLPESDSQIKHIFRNAKGHLEDTPENRKLLLDLANNTEYHAGKDSRGNEWHFKNLDDGSQIWVSIRNGVIQNGGINNPPHSWDDRSGLSTNIFGGDTNE